MFIRQLSTLALSALIGITPISFTYYEGEPIEFPFTRNDTVSYTGTMIVSDMGTTTPVNALHTYVIQYDVDLYCNSTCYYTGANSAETYGYNIDSNHVRITNYSRVTESYAVTVLGDLSQVTAKGQISSSYTYTSETSQHVFIVPITFVQGVTGNYNVAFPAVTQGMLINSLLHNVSELNDWYFVKNFLLDKDVPSSSIQTVSNYIDNGDYSSAIEYIENYYIDNSVTTNEQNETVINQYESKETDLQTLTNTENQFSIGIENDFNQRMQNVSTENNITTTSSFISSANWVKQQFDRLTVNTVFGSVLSFALLIGLAMALIGRIL